MKLYSAQLSRLFKSLLLLLGLFSLCRLAFYLANLASFTSTSFTDLSIAFAAGLRFDLAAIVFLNSVFVLMHLIPGKWFWNNVSQSLLKVLFYVVNVAAIFLNCIDLEYFKYQGKRTTADLFQLFGMGEDMKNTIPQMIVDFWYVLAVFLVIAVILVKGYQRISKKRPHAEADNSRMLIPWLAFIPLCGVMVIASRGGVQYKPIGIMSAAKYTRSHLVPLVLNTPFTVYKTFGKGLIDEKTYLSDKEVVKLFNKDKHFKSKEPFRPLNVVLIILESFSSEYIGALNNGSGFTPFLDSLMHEGLTFTNAFANAKKSIDGIPAVVASMPTLMSASYISSPYNADRLKSVAGILKSKGYQSAFFHGGNNGTMNFDNFTLMTGFDRYYGRNEYPGKGDYDGHWGVFDEPFYYFFIDKCSEMKQPFVNVIFSLSSHHPYNLPEAYKGKFPKGPLPIHESIGYADYALRRFFETAQKTTWYNNTLFVVTADHTGPSSLPHYNSKAGMFRIPVLFYHPGKDLKGFTDQVTQQTDIVPGILDYLHYDEPFSAFGNSMFDTTATPCAVNFTGDVYQVIGNNLLLHFDGNEITGRYAYKKDSLLTTNVPSTYMPEEQASLEKMVKSVLQQYNHALIHNELLPVNPK